MARNQCVLRPKDLQMNSHRAYPGSTIACCRVLLHELESMVMLYIATYITVSVPTCQARKPGAAARTTMQAQSMPRCTMEILRGCPSVVSRAARNS
jgi:hypothetical protein